MQQENQQLVMRTISAVLDSTAADQAERLTEILDKAQRIFIAGAGRSRLVGSFLAMRLMHAGYQVSMVGEIVTPSLAADDLLLVISGSGETEQLISFAKRARTLKAEVVLISSRIESALADLATQLVVIGSATSYQAVNGMPLGTVFELASLCFLEALIAGIMSRKGISEEEMKVRHANLE